MKAAKQGRSDESTPAADHQIREGNADQIKSFRVVNHTDIQTVEQAVEKKMHVGSVGL